MFLCVRVCRLCEWRGDVHSFVPARSFSRGGSTDLYWGNHPGSGASAQGGRGSSQPWNVHELIFGYSAAEDRWGQFTSILHRHHLIEPMCCLPRQTWPSDDCDYVDGWEACVPRLPWWWSVRVFHTSCSVFTEWPSAAPLKTGSVLYDQLSQSRSLGLDFTHKQTWRIWSVFEIRKANF